MRSRLPSAVLMMLIWSSCTGAPLSGELHTGPPVRLGFSIQPQAARADSTIGFVSVLMWDKSNFCVSTTAQVTVAIATGTGTSGAVLGGDTQRVSAGNECGVSFTNLTIDRPGTGYRLTATMVGLPPDTSRAFDITP